MSPLPSFEAYFRGLWGYDPFPWQSMLAERVVAGSWPKAVDLPTASGKTACIDVALYALAAQAERPPSHRTAPRRIWFVVDRRIVVDEAFERAQEISEKLQKAAEGPLPEVASRLKQVSGTKRPVAAARLRGGILRDDGWARLPSQPAIITATVDQLGSRLLFRGYGHSLLAAPIFAGLAANDSLVVLDEAHCSVPFMQTLEAVEIYRGNEWAEAPVESPFAFVVLSATPPEEVPVSAIFPGADRDRALDHPVLDKRLHAKKPADLVQVPDNGKEGADSLVGECAKQAIEFLKKDRRRIAVMVNRVRTALAVTSSLREKVGDQADVVLLTGRLRPFERDRLVNKWKRFLRADSPEQPERPVILVSTQCLEVGADFSFDALVSEAASLDALRQRFGRLDRMGESESAPSAILIRSTDADPEKAEPDPIYGQALSSTWRLLKDRSENGAIDFGVEALRQSLLDLDDLSPYLAPAPDAPLLLPAHLDLLCQTAPKPHPEPDATLFLHGMDRGAPEVRVLWRSDLPLHDTASWVEIVALCPPVGAEMLSVPLYRLRSFLGESGEVGVDADVEGVPEPAAEAEGQIRSCVAWRGRDRSFVTSDPAMLMPGEVVVIPASYGMGGLGQSEPVEALGDRMLDLWEPALEHAGKPVAVRLNRAVVSRWLSCPPVEDLLLLAEEEAPDLDAIREAIDAVLAYKTSGEDEPVAPPQWWLDKLRLVRNERPEKHPAGGIVLARRGKRRDAASEEPDLFADDDDLTSASGKEQTLDEHSEVVRRTVKKIAARCLPPFYADVLSRAAYWHDVGKLDERFQTLLHNGDELSAIASVAPLAKSTRVPVSPTRRQAIRAASKLPPSFRHEMLSAQIAGAKAPAFEDENEQDLFLHLVSSHHGHGRPFAPVSEDPLPPAVVGRLGETSIVLSQEERSKLPSAHRVDSGFAERFWRLVRRHGWWGLALLEAIVRLGDWYASSLELKDTTGDEL